MESEPVLRDADPADQARGHHPPADGPLRRAERKNPPQPQLQATRNPATPEKPDEGKQESRPDQSPEQTMRPFPPVDGLELGQRHPAVELLVLCRRLIFFEFRLPGIF